MEEINVCKMKTRVGMKGRGDTYIDVFFSTVAPITARCAHANESDTDSVYLFILFFFLGGDRGEMRETEEIREKEWQRVEEKKGSGIHRTLLSRSAGHEKATRQHVFIIMKLFSRN